MFPSVSTKINFPEAEKKILAFWSENQIYQKSLEQRKDAPSFVFFEGPPTANGIPHPGHALTRVIKDVFPRYFTMRGRRCERKAGWDTHGLPVEVEVGKELGIHSKQEIEKYGIEPFIHQCVKSVFRYTQQWEEMTRRLGFWVNLDQAYVTYHTSYVESVWWALKRLFDRGLLYQGHKVVWWWAQGGTALSAGEVGEGYRDTDDPSVYVRFHLENPEKLGIDSRIPASFVAWTTTPWTLSSNIALAVGTDFDYVVYEHPTDAGPEHLILAEALLEKTFHGLKINVAQDLKPIKRLKGADLLGLSYKPIFRYMEPTGEGRRWEVDSADFVSLDSGTGIVHVAPAFGEDDYRFAKEKGFAFLQMVLPDGTFRPEAGEFAGIFCKSADKDIIAKLKEDGVLLKRDVYRHPYPFCPRAENDPLIQYARKSWFIRTSDFKERFLANNDKIRWLPDHIKSGRFGDFLRNNVDWAISRERFWGTPLPIWQCERTGYQEAVGSLTELREKPDIQGFDVWERAKAKDPTLVDDLAIHKPYIDAVHYQSPKDPAARMRRVPEVIDCWFDSGAMSFAQWGYPHQNKDKFVDQFPADFISEAIDQTRGWFYSLLAISTVLQDDLGRPAMEFPIPFRSCIVLGHLLGEDGKKMSKRLKNYREPTYIFDTYGADAMRWFFLAGQTPWNSIRFQESAIEEVQREFLIRLQNVLSFFVIYANIDGFDPQKTPRPDASEVTLLDRWIKSELAMTAEFVTARMDELDNFTSAGRLIDFVDALSNWYVRRSRDRFWASGFSADKRAAYWTLYDSLVTLSKLIAPYVPFFAEQLFQTLVKSWDSSAPLSVHLCDWPKADEKEIDRVLADDMDLVRELVSAGRSARTEAKLKVRQPLAALEVLLADHRLDRVVSEYGDLVAEELNVKKVELAKRADDYVTFTVKPNLKLLGPRMGKNLPKFSQAISAADPAGLRQQLIEKGRATLPFMGDTIELSPEDLMITLSAKPGFSAAQGKRSVVVLSTDVTDELRAEGFAREIVHHIQGQRRELNLAFDQRIELGITASGDLAAAISANASYIQAETLAISLELAELASPDKMESVEFEGMSATIFVRAVGR